ncbi:MAG: cation-efflux pump, partial [Deltaproteobacteria bacterium]
MMSAHRHTDLSALNAGRKITWIGIGVNSILIALKIYGGLAGKSRALLADAIHSISDFLTDILVIFGLQYFRKPEDERHPYGHGKIETLATIGIGILLLLAAFRVAVSAVKAIHKGNLVAPGSYTIYIAVASIVLKEILFQ